MNGPTSGPTTGPTSGLRARLVVPSRLDVDLEVPAGAVVAVIGPNGAGKTTLLRCLAGLVADGAGTHLDVTVGDRSWTAPALSPQARRVGYVVQGQALFPHLSARENVAFGLRARGTPARAARERADGELGRLGVGHLADRRPGQLSGGQAQRVAIARALALDPDLLLLDEPFAGLDVGVAATLRIELAGRLAAYDGVALLVTHDAVDALTLADHVVVLEDGRLAQEGAPHEVAARPLTEHVARLVGLNVVREDDGLVAFAPSAVTLSTQPPTPGATSARRQRAGTVAHLAALGAGVRVTVRLDGGGHVLADVTPAAAADLGLRPGLAIWAITKETALTRYPDLPAEQGPAPLRSGHGD